MIAYAQNNDSAEKAPKPTMADAQKLAQMISSDKVKLKAYCDMGKLQEQMEQAATRKRTTTQFGDDEHRLQEQPSLMVRSLLVPDETPDDGGRVTFPKPVERQGRHMRLSSPQRVKLRAKGYDQQRRKGLNSIHGPTECFQARGIAPMRVLEIIDHMRMPRCARCERGVAPCSRRDAR